LSFNIQKLAAAQECLAEGLPCGELSFGEGCVMEFRGVLKTDQEVERV
jgi:hypothetical protein